MELISLSKLVYEGPMKGKIRFLLNKKKIEDLYRTMMCETNYMVDSGVYGEITREEAMDQVNEEHRDNVFGMYLFKTETKPSIMAFAFVDCEMKDTGYYKFIG